MDCEATCNGVAGLADNSGNATISNLFKHNEASYNTKRAINGQLCQRTLGLDHDVECQCRTGAACDECVEQY